MWGKCLWKTQTFFGTTNENEEEFVLPDTIQNMMDDEQVEPIVLGSSTWNCHRALSKAVINNQHAISSSVWIYFPFEKHSNW